MPGAVEALQALKAKGEWVAWMGALTHSSNLYASWALNSHNRTPNLTTRRRAGVPPGDIPAVPHSARDRGLDRAALPGGVYAAAFWEPLRAGGRHVKL